MNMQNKRQLVIAVAMMGMAIAAQADNCVWKSNIGSGTWNWSDEANWMQPGVPGIDDTAIFTYPQSAPFTVSFTNDVSTKLTLGTSDITKPVVVTFDLNGHTLTHNTADLNAQYALDWTVLDGTIRSHTTAGALNVGTFGNDYSLKVTIGASATFLHNGANFITVGSRTSRGELIIQDGGKLVNEYTAGVAAEQDLRVGSSLAIVDSNYPARMTITGSGSVYSNLVGDIRIAVHAIKGVLNVTDKGVLVHSGKNFMVSSTSRGDGLLNITDGGVVDARLASDYMTIGNNGTGTVTVAGSGSKLLPPNKTLYFGNSATNSYGTLIIEKGGIVDKMEGDDSIMLGYRDKATGRIIVRDCGVLRWAGGYGGVNVGGAGSAPGSIGEMIVTGATSSAIVGSFTIGQKRGHGLVTVADGGTLEAYQPITIGRISSDLNSHNGSAKLIVTGSGSVLKSTELTNVDLPSANINSAISLWIGGSGLSWDDEGLKHASGFGPGGTGLAIIEDGGLIDMQDFIGVYSNCTILINGGHTKSSKIGLDTNAVFHAILRQDDANSTALMTASGEARIWGAKLVVERGTDFTPVPGDVYTLITAGTINATSNRFSYDDSVLQDGDLIKIDGATLKVGYTENDVTLTVRSVGTLITIL